MKSRGLITDDLPNLLWPLSTKAEPGHGGVILVLEHNPNDFLLIQLAFEHAGLSHLLVHIRDLVHLFSYLAGDGHFSNRSNFPLPDLILINFTQTRPLEVRSLLDLVCQYLPETSVVLTSVPREHIDTARQFGAGDCFLKAGHFQQLVSMARSLDERLPAAS